MHSKLQQPVGPRCPTHVLQSNILVLWSPTSLKLQESVQKFHVLVALYIWYLHTGISHDIHEPITLSTSGFSEVFLTFCALLTQLRVGLITIEIQ